MRKRYLVILLPLLVLALAGTSYAWQGRMGGMGDPFGLVADESDYLIHPAKIAKGEGIKFYGDYRFNYTGVTDWDAHTYPVAIDGTVLWWEHGYLSGDEQRHDALIGAAFPLGLGKMGLFFTYAGMRGDYDGKNISEIIELKSDFDDFTLRLLYGLPISGFNVGGEVQFAYRLEKNEIFDHFFDFSNAWVNDNWIPMYLYPYDSHYWEALFKGSLEGKIGPLDLEFTLRGGFLFGSANDWHYEWQMPIGVPFAGWDVDGGVQGWRIGGDFWARYPLDDGLTLPVLVRVDYQAKTRDGAGSGLGIYTGALWDYEHERTDLAITAGGGVGKEFGKETRIAAGIYYNYLQGRDEYWLRLNEVVIDRWTMPDVTEHRALLRIVGEQRISPVVSLRAGVNSFYGWQILQGDGYHYDSISADGFHWGVGVSVGGTITLKRLTFEPFIGGGYQGLDLDEGMEHRHRVLDPV
jgi:hypothetical protein